MCKKLLPLISLVLVLGPACTEQTTQESKQAGTVKTYVYKVVDDCTIKADVYGGKPGCVPRPVAIWIHGGALISGSRKWVDKVFNDRLLDEGFVIVSIDYRLTPETKIAGIIEDVRDAYRWVREKGPTLFGADPRRIGVLGGSAGGYLTLMTGFCVEPRPKALVSLYGYGDIVGDWYSQPDPFYCTKPPVSKQEAYSIVGSRVISEAVGAHYRGRFYLYCRQQGLWPKEVVGHDPHTEPEAFKPYCPVQNVTLAYPPTMLIHGDRDTDVPHEQSVRMASELTRVGVTHELITLKGAGHVFTKADPKELEQAQDKAITFFKRYVKNAKN